MAWDSSLPTNDTKIRNLGIEIRPNNEAIERGDDVTAVMVNTSSTMLQQYSAQFIERNGRANSNDPVTEADTFYMYCKQDANGIAEGHVKDPAGNVIPITEDGKLGSQVTGLYTNAINFDTSVTYNANNMHRAWALTNSAQSAFDTNKNFVGITNNGTGIFTVDVTGLAAGGANFASGTSYGVLCTAAFSGRVHVASVDTRTATSFRVVVRNDKGEAANVAVTVTLLT